MAKPKAADASKVVVSVKMDPALKQRLDVYCAKVGRYVQDVVAEAVEEFLRAKR